MEVNPDELVRLADQSESAARVLALKWAEARAALVVAQESLGDGPAATAVAESYSVATTAADDVVRSLAQVLLTGVSALQQAAHDAREADEKATERFLSVRDGGVDDGRGSGREHDHGHHREGPERDDHGRDHGDDRHDRHGDGDDRHGDHGDGDRDHGGHDRDGDHGGDHGHGWGRGGRG